MVWSKNSKEGSVVCGPAAVSQITKLGISDEITTIMMWNKSVRRKSQRIMTNRSADRIIRPIPVEECRPAVRYRDVWNFSGRWEIDRRKNFDGRTVVTRMASFAKQKCKLRVPLVTRDRTVAATNFSSRGGGGWRNKGSGDVHSRRLTWWVHRYFCSGFSLLQKQKLFTATWSFCRAWPSRWWAVYRNHEIVKFIFVMVSDKDYCYYCCFPNVSVVNEKLFLLKNWKQKQTKIQAKNVEELFWIFAQLVPVNFKILSISASAEWCHFGKNKNSKKFTST